MEGIYPNNRMPAGEFWRKFRELFHLAPLSELNAEFSEQYTTLYKRFGKEDSNDSEVI